MNPTQAASRIFCALDTAYAVAAARRMAQEIAPEGAETTRESD